MIEYKMDFTPKWVQVSSSVWPSADVLIFANYQIRINGQIFSENTIEFRDALKAEKIWDRLKN